MNERIKLQSIKSAAAQRMILLWYLLEDDDAVAAAVHTSGQQQSNSKANHTHVKYSIPCTDKTQHVT